MDQLDFMSTINKFKPLTQGLILPHAGQKYAGPARREALSYVSPNTKYLIYIASLHKLDNTDHIYLLEGNNYYQEQIRQSGLPFKLDKKVKSEEHSYQWVKPELLQYFQPNLKILAIAPSNHVDLNKLTSWLIKVYNQHKLETVIIATTDLTHYGSNFHNSSLLSFPEKLNCQIREEQLIIALTQADLKNHKLLQETSCGPYAILIFLKLAKQLNWLGRVVDYYDSHQIRVATKNFNQPLNSLNLYTISHQPVQNLVSYVSLIYGNYPSDIYLSLLPLDLNLVFGFFKTIISFQLYQVDFPLHNLTLPSWTPFSRMKNGVFIGSELQGQTNCCTGIFQSSKSTLQNINLASQNCQSDALSRWNLPYKIDNLDLLGYKLDILTEKSKWKTYPAIEAEQHFNLDSHLGMQLIFSDGHQAIFIPQVAEDHQDSWTVRDYMRNLTVKAYGDGRSGEKWREPNFKNIIKIFSSQTYSLNNDV